MLPQELMQLPADALLILKAGLPPVRGRKILYYREPVFTARLRPAPVIPPASPAPIVAPGAISTAEVSGMDFDSLVRDLAAEGLAPPPAGAPEEAFGDWIDRLIDTAARPTIAIEEARDR